MINALMQSSGKKSKVKKDGPNLGICHDQKLEINKAMSDAMARDKILNRMEEAKKYLKNVRPGTKRAVSGLRKQKNNGNPQAQDPNIIDRDDGERNYQTLNKLQLRDFTAKQEKLL